MRVRDDCGKEPCAQLMQLLGSAHEHANWQLFVWTRILNLFYFVRISPDCLKHTAHAAHEHDLLLHDFATAAFDICSLNLFVLFLLLLSKKRLDFLFAN